MAITERRQAESGAGGGRRDERAQQGGRGRMNSGMLSEILGVYEDEEFFYFCVCGYVEVFVWCPIWLWGRGLATV